MFVYSEANSLSVDYFERLIEPIVLLSAHARSLSNICRRCMKKTLFPQFWHFKNFLYPRVRYCGVLPYFRTIIFWRHVTFFYPNSQRWKKRKVWMRKMMIFSWVRLTKSLYMPYYECFHDRKCLRMEGLRRDFQGLHIDTRSIIGTAFPSWLSRHTAHVTSVLCL